MSCLKIYAINRKRGSIRFFDMHINSLRQLLTSLDQKFSFFLYTSDMTSPEHSGDPCDVIFNQKRKKKLGILEKMLQSIVCHQIRKNPSIKNENLEGRATLLHLKILKNSFEKLSYSPG